MSSAPPGTQAPGTTSVGSNPFTDSHGVSTLTSINVHNLDSVELETYRSQTTGGLFRLYSGCRCTRLITSSETAVYLGLHNRDETTQEVVTHIPDQIPTGGDGENEEGEMLRMFD